MGKSKKKSNNNRNNTSNSKSNKDEQRVQDMEELNALISSFDVKSNDSSSSVSSSTIMATGKSQGQGDNADQMLPMAKDDLLQNVSIVESENQGRYVVATRRIPQGERIISDLPYAYVVSEQYLQGLCTYCFQGLKYFW